jgi:protocatechuate 4,5-dioxygenase beta chain/2,3-dihydroxyphenylpropionate 1,2-dioxygenase
MGEIVAALGTCHTPYLFTRPPDENAQQLDQAVAAIEELGRALDESKPDVILMFGADHVETFSVTCVPSFAIVAGNRAIAKFAGREHNLPIHREMAEDILNKLVVDHNFDMAYSEDAELGHAFSIPFEFLIGKRNIPVVPFFTNVYVPPLPTPQRCAALGKAIAQIVKGRKERVAIVTSGGMSHFPGTTKYTSPEFDFDRWLVAQMEAGNTDALLKMTGTQLDEVGNTEMLNWAVMFGAIGPVAGELIDYIPTWHHGLAMMRFLPARPHAAKMDAREQYGGFQFQNQGYQFYKHPPAEAYALNKLLFESRHSQQLRDRIVDTFDAVADEYGLQGQQRQAARAMIDVAKGPLVSDHVKPLADAGCHPLQALMSLHVIYSTTHKARAQQPMAGAGKH